MHQSADIAIVGAGIAGLAHAYMALKKGYRVVLFEREERAIGASIRNFGLLWPIGQESGDNLDRAIRSRKHWQEIASKAGIWINNNGSLHLAYHDDEWDLLNEFYCTHKESYDCTMLPPEKVSAVSNVVKCAGLLGAMYSRTESTVYSRDAIHRIPVWLEEKYGLICRFGHVVKDIVLPRVYTSREVWVVGKVIICSGADFETLYPEVFKSFGVKKCKLQMMKATSRERIDIGPSLCAGLTLTHYGAFRNCKALANVIERYKNEHEAFGRNGIHVLVSQNNHGEFIIGDSHEYSPTPMPFDSEEVNELIWGYLNTFVHADNWRIVERWNGVYPKVSEGTNLIHSPEKDVLIVNGLGGAGMTLSFGLAEEVIEEL